MIEQRTPDWHSQRRGRVTASNIGGILGISPFAKPSDVMRRMVREWQGLESEFTGNAATEWGVHNEPGAIIQYEMQTGNEVEKCGFFEFDVWLGASPDGLIGKNGMIEVKCPFSLRTKQDPVFKKAKDQLHYYAQMQIQMFVTAREWCDFYQWCPAGDCIENVPYDPNFVKTILPVLHKFYDQYLLEREK